MADGRRVVGPAPANGGGGRGRPVVGLAPPGAKGPTGRVVVGPAPAGGDPFGRGGSSSSGGGTDPFGRGGGSSSGGGSSDPFGRGSGSGGGKKGGGLLGKLEGGAHWVASKAELAGHDIKAIPGGVIGVVNKGAVQPWKDVITTGHVSKKTNANIDALTKQTADSTVNAVAHPLRDPFLTLTTLLPALHGAGNVAVRGGAAVEAARAGEGVRGAVKAAAAKPVVKPRLLRMGDVETPLHPAKTPTGRAVQGVYDKVLQHSLDHPDGSVTGRIAAHAAKRIGGAQDETARYQQRMREAPANALDQSAKKLTSKTQRVAGRVHQAALELTSTQTSPEKAAAYHLAQAEEGIAPARNRVVAKLYQTVHDRGLLTKNENGEVIVNAADHPKLAQADIALARVQGKGDEILSRYGIRSAEALRERVNAPGRIRAGGEYVPPTPGRLGKSPALDTATAERDRLAAIHEKALAQEEKWHRDQKTKNLGPLTEADARARLAQLDAQHDAMAAKIIPEVSPYGGEISRREQLARNTRNADSRARKTQTVKADELSLASDKLHEIAAKGGSPAAKALADVLNERARLRDVLASRAEASMAGDEAPALPRGAAPAHVSVPPASNPYRNRIVQIGTRLEAAQAKVDRLQAAAEKHTTPTGVVGGGTARPGRGYVSYVTGEKKPPANLPAASPGPVVGEARSPIASKTFTGAGIEKGLVPDDVTGQASRHFRSILRFVNTTERRNAAIRTGSDTRRSVRDVLVKVPGEEHAKIPQIVEEALGRKKPTTDDLEGLHAALEAYRQDLLPGLSDHFAADMQHEIGTTAKDAAAAEGLDAPAGYKWVDKNVLGDLAKPGPSRRGLVARRVDDVNSAVTAATVYFKIGHVGTRVLTNAATNIIQGSATPVQIGKSLELWKALSHEDRSRALAAAGQHGYAAMPHEGTSPIARFAGAGAKWWAKHADAPFRFNSIAYEARKAGYNTPEKFTKLLDDLQHPDHLTPAEAAKVDAIAKNANREGIAYDRLNNLERRYITRAFWFYAWLKGSSVFAGRTLLEHPYKSAALGAAGARGREAQQEDLGVLPSYEGGLFKVGNADPFGRPLVADFSTFSPFATPAGLLDVVAGKGKVADSLNPALAGAGSLAYKLSPYGQPSTSPILDSLKTTLGPAWPVQLAEAYLGRHQDQSRRMFPKSPGLAGTESPLLRALVGPAMPRRINLLAAASAAARERAGR